MECPHCNQEHSENALFCENTGKKIEKQLKSCTNPYCLEFGKYSLPSEAIFCPRCGEIIDNSESLGTAMLNHQSVQRLFPVYGTFVLGKTSADEFISSKFNNLVDQLSKDNFTMSFRGMQISQDYCDDAFSVLEIVRGVDFPEQWQDDFGWGWHLSLKEMIHILHDNGFILSKIESPYYHETPFPRIIAYSSDGRYEMVFKYGMHGRTKWGCELLNFKMLYHKNVLNTNIPDVYEEYCKEWEYYDF